MVDNLYKEPEKDNMKEMMTKRRILILFYCVLFNQY